MRKMFKMFRIFKLLKLLTKWKRASCMFVEAVAMTLVGTPPEEFPCNATPKNRSPPTAMMFDSEVNQPRKKCLECHIMKASSQAIEHNRKQMPHEDNTDESGRNPKTAVDRVVSLTCRFHRLFKMS